MIERITSDIKNLACRFNDDDVLALASQLAYSLIFSFFPFLIFLMTLVGYSPISSGEVLIGLNKILPTNLLELIHNTVVEVVDGRNSKLLSLSLLLTVWSASSGFNAVIKGLNKAYDESEDRSIFKVQLISILCTFGLTFIIMLTMLLLVFGQVLWVYLSKRLGLSFMFNKVWNIVRYTVMFLTTIFIFAALYHYTPSRRLTWKEAMPGAAFSAAGLVGVSLGFAFYVNNFANYSRFYGSIGAVIMLLTWLFLLSIVIIMGGELNATLTFDREGKTKLRGKKF